MKFQFEAIDEAGRPVRGVLRADDELAARDVLRGEGLFPKRVSTVSEETRTTWAPRRRPAPAADNSMAAMPAAVRRQRVMLRAPGGWRRGELAFPADGVLLFRADDEAGSEVVALDTIEVARLVGFPWRRLELVLVTGRTLEFPAGVVFARPFFRDLVRAVGKATGG
jgi:hypothetical protein